MSFPEASPSGIPIVSVKPGDVIAGKYEVEKILAAGGMGVVLSAQHKQLKRRVALKFLLPELCATPDLVERFLREAQAMTGIQNEHVARVIDVGTTDDGSPFMVMEYLEGEDLGQALDRRGAIPTFEAVDYVLQAMEALAEAHTNGFVHRDLKPSNLFVTQRPDGSPLVKVLDFGISKSLSVKDEQIKLTQTRGMLGSPLYMAPEQIRSSKSVDTRADIWALGIILHELMAGKGPFDGDNLPSVLAAIVADDPVSLDSVKRDTPEGLSEVILRCLSRDREQRYATVADLARALEPFAPAESQVSIDRIRRTLAHAQRMSSAPDLRAKTTPNAASMTPRGGAPLSGLAQTAAVPPGAPSRPSPPSRPSGAGIPGTPTTPAPQSIPSSDAGTDSTFGKYKLLALLGQGGMADVFLAALGGPEGLGFSKLVVIKRLRSHFVSDPELVSMLVDEARIAAKLNHPNVVQTHEVGVIDQEYYIAMEYLDGQPLHQIVQRTADKEPMSLAFRLGVVRDLLAGIHHAHELVDYDGSPVGLVHRDVTPHNVFVTYDGQVKVVDFGIAKAKGRATETQLGVLKGKVRYMSPEQAGGQEIDRRADVFGAGAILWELLTGERMWKGLDDVAIIQKLLLDKIPSSPRAVRPDVSKALDAIVKKALARKKEDRYETAQEFQLDIERYMETEGLKCSSRELGGWVAELFADRRKQARALIDDQLSKLRAANPGPSFHVLKLRDSGSAAPSSSSSLRLGRLDRDPIVEDSPSRPASLARSHPGRTGSSGSSRSRWILAGATLVIATALVLGALARSKTQRTAALPSIEVDPPESTSAVPMEPPPVVVIAPSATIAPATGPVRVELTATTPGAEFATDGKPRARAPVLLTRPRSKEPHRITVTAPGHRPETKNVTFEEDVVWSAELVPTRGAGTTPTSRTAASAAPVASAAPAAPTTSAGRRKRELDPDNPYSGQSPQ